MILFQNWTIQTDGSIIARQYDNLTRTITVSGEIPGGWEWAVLVQVDGAMDILPMTENEKGLSVMLTAEQLSISGFYNIQLRATQGDLMRHTNVIQAYIPPSLSGDTQWPTIPSEFSEVERRIRGYASNPPIIGENGNWWLWNGETYEDSGRASAGERGEKGEPGEKGEQGSPDAVLYAPQTLTDEQKAQTRENINAVGCEELFDKDPSGEYEDVKVADLDINDFSLRPETPRGDTALIAVVPGGTYVLAFDSCPYDGAGYGSASLFLNEYTADQRQTVTDSRLNFKRLGTDEAPSTTLYSYVFPNGGRAVVTVGGDTAYIKLMFDAYLGAPERLPELTLVYKSPVLQYGCLKKEKLPLDAIDAEHLKNCAVVSNNLFNKATATTGETVYLGKNTSGEELYGWYCAGAVNYVGAEKSSTGYDSTSVAIEVEGGQVYHKCGLTIINFFDENDMWINHPAVGAGSLSFVTPNAARYARLTFISADIERISLTKGDKALPYDDYKRGAPGIATEEYPEITQLLARHGLGASWMQEYMWKIAEEAHKYTAPNRHTFLFISDTHAGTMSDRPMSMAANMTKYVPCSYIAHGGDIVDGISPKANELLLLTTLARNANEAQCPVYYAKGNHDWNAIYKTINPNASDNEYILNAELASRTNCFNKKKVHGNVEEMYFYVDDEVTKVRTIFINGFNEGKNGSVADLRGTVQVYTQAQVEWFANEALDFTDKEDCAEWGVIVIGHQMIDGRIARILVNFKNGTSQDVSVTENGETFTVTVDFTKQGAMDVIAVFVGDNHYDDVVPVSSTQGIAEILILNASLANDYADGHHPSSESALLPPDKEFGTENETAFDIVTVDRENHLIYLTRYGARSYVYNEETGAYDKIAARTRVIDYAAVECVVREAI